MDNNGESLLRTDLAIESIESIKDDSLTSSVEEKDGIKVTTVVVSKDMEKLIEKNGMITMQQFLLLLKMMIILLL